MVFMKVVGCYIDLMVQKFSVNFTSFTVLIQI